MADDKASASAVCNQLIPPGMFRWLKPVEIPGVGNDTTLEQVSAEIFKGDEGDYTPQKFLNGTTPRTTDEMPLPLWIFEAKALPLNGLFTEDQLKGMTRFREEAAKASKLIRDNAGNDGVLFDFTFKPDGATTPADAAGLSDEDKKLVAHYLALAMTQGRCIERATTMQARAEADGAQEQALLDRIKGFASEAMRLLTVGTIAWFVAGRRGAAKERAKGPGFVEPLSSKALRDPNAFWGGRLTGFGLVISKPFRWIGRVGNWARHTEGMRRLTQAENVLATQLERLTTIEKVIKERTRKGQKTEPPLQETRQVAEALREANRIRRELGLPELGANGKPVNDRGTRRRK